MSRSASRLSTLRANRSYGCCPHKAATVSRILSKRHELGLLSNFAPTPFTFHGRRYASLEGFWQMMLYPEGPDAPRAKFPGIAWKHSRDEVAQMTRAARGLTVERRTSFAAMIVGSLGMLCVLLVVYAGANALTRGYFRPQLRVMVVLVIAVAATAVLLMMA